MTSITDYTPSLARSDDSTLDASSAGPATPSERSPFMSAQIYTTGPTMDAILLLPHRAPQPPSSSLHTRLPDILDPETAANVPVRHVCCIGAGYVGMFALARAGTRTRGRDAS